MIIFVGILILTKLGFPQKIQPKNIILVLGSDDIQTLEERTNLAFQLYQIDNKMDYIIVSGGCGAHGSSLCEASEMKAKLLSLGVPESIVVKEEKSQTTLQNYIYSRMLKDDEGNALINKNDNLYVVSNHWHAISVANRFQKYDGVQAKYFVSGSLTPKEKDAVDYVGIFHGYPDQDQLVEKQLKNNIIGAVSLGKKDTLLMNAAGEIYLSENGKMQKEGKNLFFKQMPAQWDQHVDNLFQDKKTDSFFLSRKNLLYKISKKGRFESQMYLTDYFHSLPAAWTKRGIDAISIVEDAAFVFYKDSVWIGKREGRKGFVHQKTERLSKGIKNWPFSWGTGDIDNAFPKAEEGIVRLYRANQYIDVSTQSWEAVSEPQKTKIIK